MGLAKTNSVFAHGIKAPEEKRAKIPPVPTVEIPRMTRSQRDLYVPPGRRDVRFEEKTDGAKQAPAENPIDETPRKENEKVEKTKEKEGTAVVPRATTARPFMGITPINQNKIPDRRSEINKGSNQFRNSKEDYEPLATIEEIIARESLIRDEKRSHQKERDDELLADQILKGEVMVRERGARRVPLSSKDPS
jgi:hypothetical protein